MAPGIRGDVSRSAALEVRAVLGVARRQNDGVRCDGGHAGDPAAADGRPGHYAVLLEAQASSSWEKVSRAERRQSDGTVPAVLSAAACESRGRERRSLPAVQAKDLELTFPNPELNVPSQSF